MKPSIGRVVWYYPARHGDQQPWPGLIARVNEDETINVGGFRDDGTPFNSSEVPLYLPNEAYNPNRPHCEWMPYQVTAAGNELAKVGTPSSNGLKPISK